MKVLHVIPSVAARYGGPSAAVRGMAGALAARGAAVTVATTNADGPDALDVALDAPSVEQGVTYRYFARSLPGEWKFSWPLTRWLFANVATFDVVHVHALFSYSTIPGCRAAERAGVPYVLRPLGTLGAHSLSRRSWKKRPYLALVERHHLAHAAAIHVTSRAEAEGLRALGYGDRARVVSLGVDTAASPPAARAPGDGDVVRFVSLSRLEPSKGLGVLVDALALLPADARARVQLTIAGGGNPAYEAQLQQQVRDRGLTGTVRLAGYVEGAAKRDLLAGSDVFVLPSYHENFGIAVAEALAAGLPVIVSDQVGIADDVAAAGAGAVVPIDAGAVARAIESLATDAAARSRMAAAAWRLARDRYSWERAGAELEAVYREAIASSPRGLASRSGAVAGASAM